ncbi:MAG: glycerol-3-phosphate acyltransferase [Ignavibacteriae bacterium]|nr:glycerol-3-phosphate acyltransferase [Ignavibacteriota bacterium]
MPYIISVFLGYLLGSFPTAYLFVKQATRLDIRESGSKNVGAMNAFEVSNSKLTGTLVMLIDIVKGTLAVVFSAQLFGWQNGLAIGLSGIASIVGHNYPVWLNFRGGRGLSTTAGVMLVLSWLFVVIWCSVFAFGYKLFDDIHKANIFASVVSPLAMFLLPERLLKATLLPSITSEVAVIVSFVACVLILLRHADQIILMMRDV